MLLSWHINQPTEVANFVLARAVETAPNQYSGYIENNKLTPPIEPPTLQTLDNSLRYTTTDTGVEANKSYVYQLDVISHSGTTLYTQTADSPLPGAASDPEICDPNRTSATATPTPSFTPIIFPTSTNTPPHTVTPTWTPTPTVTPTPTWTLTPLPSATNTPPPTETSTPIPTDTPLPATETPSPTFTITPTFTPDIQTPTPEQNGGENPPAQPSETPIGEIPEIPTETPTPELPAMDAPAPAQATPLAGEGESAPPSDAQAVDGEEAADPLSADENGGEVEEIAMQAAAVEAAPVEMDEFRPRLLPRSRASLFRYGLYGVAGLAFVGALGFLLAGIGLIRKQ